MIEISSTNCIVTNVLYTLHYCRTITKAFYGLAKYKFSYIQIISVEKFVGNVLPSKAFLHFHEIHFAIEIVTLFEILKTLI